LDKLTAIRQNEYGKTSKTLQGELVRSQAEKQIADYFYSNRIRYSYESEAKTTLSAFRDKISKPDFYLPDYNIFVEYWGLIDVPDSQLRVKYKEEMRWKKKQYYNNGIKFISLYPWHLNDLDGGFRAQFKLTMGKDLVAGSVGEKSVYALSISVNFQKLLQNGLPAGLVLSKLRLLYSPYYFVEYDCFTQGSFLYERVNLGSKGIVVLEGQKGEVVDSSVLAGTPPTILRAGSFVGCGTFRSVEIPKSQITERGPFSSMEAFPAKISKDEAERITKIEIARNLSQTYSRKLKNGSISTKTLRPSERDVRVVSIKLLNAPLITAIFTYRDRAYTRVIQATTDRIISDDFVYCNVGQRHLCSDPILLCQDCGNLTCKDHGKNCTTCGRALCANHISSKGVLLKKYYCPNHVPL